jgi:MFS family permease
MTSLVAWAIIITIPLGGVLIDRIGHATMLTIASFAAFGFSAMLSPMALSPALMTFIGAVAGVPAGAIMVLRGGITAAKSSRRNGRILYMVLRWHNCADASRRYISVT